MSNFSFKREKLLIHLSSITTYCKQEEEKKQPSSPEGRSIIYKSVSPNELLFRHEWLRMSSAAVPQRTIASQLCGVTSLPFSVRGDESGVERLSHISTAMAVHFLLIYKYIQMLFCFVLVFFPIPKMTFYSRCFVQYFSATIQQTYSRHPSTWTNKTSLKPVTTVYLDADIAILVFANYCKILIKC